MSELDKDQRLRGTQTEGIRFLQRVNREFQWLHAQLEEANERADTVERMLSGEAPQPCPSCERLKRDVDRYKAIFGSAMQERRRLNERIVGLKLGHAEAIRRQRVEDKEGACAMWCYRCGQSENYQRAEFNACHNAYTHGPVPCEASAYRMRMRELLGAEWEANNGERKG